MAAHDRVLQDRQPGEHPGRLEGAKESLASDDVRTKAADVLAVQLHPSAVRPIEVGHQVEQRRLAGAVRPYQCGDGSRRHVKAYVVDRHDATERLADALNP